jgi:asparagine synthase (glutamine-hydrolysing)
VEGARILSTAGRHLIGNYWGNYVALLTDPVRHVLRVVRAPAATLPCLHFNDGSLDIYLSRTEDAAAIGAFSFTIDQRALARSLIGPLSSGRTAITEIREILPGFCDQMSPSGHTQHCYWDPIKFAAEKNGTTPKADHLGSDDWDSSGAQEVQDAPPVSRHHRARAFVEAANRLRTVTQAVIQDWAQATPRILLALSGGLDSSIVAGCLNTARARPQVTCVTHYSEGVDSDERAFAHLVGTRAQCRVIDVQHSPAVDLRTALHGIRSENNPGLRIRAIDRIEPDLARTQGADATYKGSGGDELWCRHHTYYYLSDYLREEGFGRALLPLLLHSAATEGETIWTIFARALRDAFLPRRWNLGQIFIDDQHDQSLLHGGVVDTVLADSLLDSPHCRSTRECSPGRLWQISLVTGPRPYYLPATLEGDPPQIAPLLSQPIIETCLRIPTWFQMHGRRDRALARAAFQSVLPLEVLDRRWKGGAEQNAWKILRQNRPFVRELLLDGQLVREHLVDRSRLERALSATPNSMIRASVPLFDLIGAEAWLQAWAVPSPPCR